MSFSFFFQCGVIIAIKNEEKRSSKVLIGSILHDPFLSILHDHMRNIVDDGGYKCWM